MSEQEVNATRKVNAARAQAATSESTVRPEANIIELAAGWASAAGSRVKSTAELALAEARLAAMSIVLMLLLAVIAAVFLLGAWGLLMAGVVTGLMALGVPGWISLVGLGLIHVVSAWLLFRWMLRLSIHLELPATRRQLGGNGAAEQKHVA